MNIPEFSLQTTIAGLIVAVCLGTIAIIGACSSSSTASIEAHGSLSDPIGNTVEVTPGKYEVTLPFKIENVDVTEATYTVHIEPGQGQDISVIIKRTGQDSIQVELAPRIEIR